MPPGARERILRAILEAGGTVEQPLDLIAKVGHDAHNTTHVIHRLGRHGLVTYDRRKIGGTKHGKAPVNITITEKGRRYLDEQR